MKKLLLAFCVLASLSAYAQDAAKTKKCSMLKELTADIINDRDKGMQYEARVEKNRKAAGDFFEIHKFLYNMTKAAYTDLKKIPKLEITNSAFYACMKD